MLFFVGDLSYIKAYYENPETLIYRDAGAMLQTLAFSAEAFGLGFCSLGALGGQVLKELGLSPREALVAGLAAVGRHQLG